MAIKLAERIREARIRTGITQGNLAKRIGISYPTLNKYERGHRSPKAELLGRIAEELNCDPGWLLTGVVSKTDQFSIDMAVQANHPAGDIFENLKAVNIYTVESLLSPSGEGLPASSESIYLPESLVKTSSVAIRVSGESMASTIRQDAIVGVNLDEKLGNEGKVYLLRLRGKKAVIRRIFWALNMIILRAENDMYPDIELETAEVERGGVIIGRVEWVLQAL